MNAVDTNVLLYSVDRNEPARQLVAQQLLGQLRASTEPTILLWQVLGEVAQQLRRWSDQEKLTPAAFAQHIQAFRHVFPLVLPTAETFDSAMSLAERFSLSHWDSMILGLPGRRRNPPLHRRHRRAEKNRRDSVDQSIPLITVSSTADCTNLQNRQTPSPASPRAAPDE